MTTIISKSNKLTDRLLSLYGVLKENSDIDFLIDTGRGRMIYADYWLRKWLRQSFKIVSWYHISLDAYETQTKYFKYADHFLAISSGIKDQLINSGISENKIDVIYNPILRKPIIPLNQENPYRFAYVGRLHEEQKNLHELFQGLHALDSSIYQLDIYGEGPQIAEQKQWAKELGVNVTWNGWFKNPWEEVAKNSVNALLMTSNYEGFSMVLAEADDFVLHLKKMIERGTDWNQEKIQNSIGSAYLDSYIGKLNAILQKLK